MNRSGGEFVSIGQYLIFLLHQVFAGDVLNVTFQIHQLLTWDVPTFKQHNDCQSDQLHHSPASDG